MSKRRADKPTGRGGGPGSLRIIGGQWRGRRLPVPDRTGLRPTSDRVRETLFNWLAPVLPGARCLDLFAGTGALGFEAASRGAGEVLMIERDRMAAAGLRANRNLLAASQVSVQQADALQWLRRGGSALDIVFLDPPFAQNLLAPALHALGEHAWLKPSTLIYLELARDQDMPVLPRGWVLSRDKTAGQVRYALATPAD